MNCNSPKKEHAKKYTKIYRKTALFHACIAVLLSVALALCVAYEEDIDSFFGYDTQDTSTYNINYSKASSPQRPSSSFGSSRESSNPELQRDSISSPAPSAFIPEPSPTPDPTPTPKPEPMPVLSTEPSLEPTLEPAPTLDPFSCLGIYENDNGNSIELRLNTEFHEMTYDMRFYYNQGMNSLRGRGGYRTGRDYSSILFTVTYHDEDYPFTIQTGDGYILVKDSNRFGPFDGHEFAGTFYMTKQFTVPDWIRNS